MVDRPLGTDSEPLSGPADSEPPTDRTAAVEIPTYELPDDDSFARGLTVRRAVLGHAHVDAALASATELDRDFQAYITRAAWGEVWARPGLPRHTRHLLTIAMLATLDRQDELGMHLRATANTGVTLAEVREVLLQVAVYAGVPAANAAFKTARRVLVESAEKGGK
jgi:4-carboxymuconolactone decarboxylase